MSAYVVDKAHIDALVRAGLVLPARQVQGGRLRWFWPEITQADREATYQAGAAWGPRSAQLAEERRRELTPSAGADRVGAMLWSENVRSVCFRYDEPEDADELPGPVGFGVLDVAGYRFGPGVFLPDVDPVAVLKAIDGYEYQSCEHPGWEASEAHAFCEALRRAAIGCLPGYAEASWEVHR